MIDFDRITLGILAGGRAARLNGADKALLQFGGETLLARTLRTFPENYSERLLSYNRTADGSLVSGLRVVADARPDFPGPLAALETLSATCRTKWLLTVPVDCRDIPDSLAADLIGHAGPDGAVLQDADGLQPLLALWRVDALRPAIEAAFAAGELAAHRLASRLDQRVHDISPRRLGNLNTPADFALP
jgi:molybdopterin-guanine dinucleotide biosynthesis protein A